MKTEQYSPLSPVTIFRFLRDVKNLGSPQAVKNLVGKGVDYPDAFSFRFGFKNFHYIMNPEWFSDIFTNLETFEKPPSVVRYVSLHGKTGIFTSNGDVWKQQRSILQPHFMKAALTGHEPAVQQESKTLVTKWQAAQGTQDMYEDLRDFSLRILFLTVFKYDTKERFNDLKHSIDILNGFLFKNLLNPFTFLFKFYFPASGTVKDAKDTLESIVSDICAPYYGAFHEGVLVSEILNAAGYYTADSDEKREDAKMQAFDEIWQIVSAGYEATASSLTWAVAELAQRPEYQDKLRQEIRLTVGDQALTIENMAHLKNQTKHLAEITRLYPTLHTTVPRRCTKDAEIGKDPQTGESYKISKGDIVLVPLINVQKDPRFFTDPETFNPERDTASAPRFAKMPFLMGPHTCVGRAMFEQQAKSAITEILRSGVISLPSGMPKTVYKTTILPSTHCPLTFTPLNDNGIAAPPAVLPAPAQVITPPPATPSRCPFARLGLR